jgi:arabinan endo-1,5-alpha-L-arabinosidase
MTQRTRQSLVRPWLFGGALFACSVQSCVELNPRTAPDPDASTAGTGGNAGTAGAAGTANTAGTAGAPGGADGSGGGVPEDGSALDGSGGSDGGIGAGGHGDDVGVHDPANPPRALELAGDLQAHDPALIAAEGSYHLFRTGRGIPIKRSANLTDWTNSGRVFETNPVWIEEQIPGATDLWAPDISWFEGLFHLYYSASTFGSNRSCIGHASTASLTAGPWTDHGSIICSNTGSSQDDWNAIDPNVIIDPSGAPWLAFGSFWSGIKLIRLDRAGARDGDELISLAQRTGSRAIEAPFIVARGSYYYLFASFDACCRGASSTYNLRVGRSSDLRGPYVDRGGVPMMSGGGTLVLESNTPYHGPGHNAVLIENKLAYNVYHAYDANDSGAAVLRISQLVWDADGWPLSGGP